MIVSGSGYPERLSACILRVRIFMRLRQWLTDDGDRSLAQRVAGAAFLIRIFSAALAYVTQIALARWMGEFEFGIYIYVWTWVMILGGAVDLGLASSAQRFIPNYTSAGATEHLRGFLSGSRWLVFAIATCLSLLGFVLILMLRPFIDDTTIVPLAVACVILPIYGILHIQDGIARSYNWINLALVPGYIIRPILLLLLLGGAFALGYKTDATTAIAVSAITIWVTGLAQTISLNRKLRHAVHDGDKSYEPGKWLAVSLPMFMVESIYLLLMYVDIVMLKHFRTPEEVAIYYAGAKTLALVAFVYFAVAAASAHKFAEYFTAGDRARLNDFLSDSIRWTFWPSCVAIGLILACGLPMLRLFGPQYVDGYPVMFVLAAGFLARASIGPGERFLNMLGEQKACAIAAAFSLAVCLVLGITLIPRLGIMGAAVATSAAFIVESALIFAVAKRRLGYHLFIWGGPRSA